jgi:signal transduction histidine kinase
MRDSLDFESAVMYMPDPDGRYVLTRFAGGARPGLERGFRQELTLDPMAWKFVIGGGSPIIFREVGSWLVANPFVPEATSWMVLKLASDLELCGVVVASASHAISLDPVDLMTLGSIADLLSAGIQTKRLREEVQRVAVEQERLRFAANLHDGLAQDLATAVRELALMDSDQPLLAAAGNRERLREAVTSAHVLVRAGLNSLYGNARSEDLESTADAVCDRFRRRGLWVTLETEGAVASVPTDVLTAVLRVLHEALANVLKHAAGTHAAVDLRFADGLLVLTVVDDGHGIHPDIAAESEPGHFGLGIMRDRARNAGGTLEVSALDASTGQHGTQVRLEIPLRDRLELGDGLLPAVGAGL